MKKNKVIILLALLSSCYSPTTSEIYSSLSDNSSVSSFSSQEIVFDKEFIINFLSNASDKSYQINYQVNGVDQFDIWTDKYFFVSTYSKGYLELNSFDSYYGKTILYNFSLENNEVKLGSCLTTINSIGREVPVKSLDNFNYFTLWDDSKFNQDKLINAGELGIYTEDKDFIDLIAGLLGYYGSSQQGAFSKAFFSYQENGLNIKLEVSNNYVNTSSIKEISASICNVGIASIDSIDDFVNSFVVTDEKIDDEIKNIIAGNNTHLKAKMECVKNNQTITIYEEEVKIDSTHILVSMKENNITSDRMIEKAKQDDEKGNYLKGDSISSFVDGKNEVISYSNGVKFEEYSFPYDYKEDVLNGFRKVSENQYHYFAFQGDEYIASLLRNIPGSGNEIVSSIDLFTDNDTYKMLITYEKQGYFDEALNDNVLYQYQCEIEFYKLSSTIESVSPYQEIEGQTEIIKNAFDYLKKENSYYHAEGYDVVEKSVNPEKCDVNEIYVTEDTILISERKFEVLNNIKGWHKKDNKIIPFVIQKDTDGSLNIVATKPSEDGLLSQYIPWSVSENVFKIENNNIVPRPNVINIHQYMFVGPYAPSMIVSSLKMEKDELNRINKITYDCDNVLSQSKEQVDIDYDNYQLPNEYQKLIDQLEEFKHPTTWNEESPLIYQRIVSFLGEDNVNKLPYLYDEKNFGIRTASIIDDVNTGLAKYLHIYTSVLALPEDYDFYNSSFVDNYKELLENLNFIKQENMIAPHNGSLYLLDNILIEVCNKDVDGIYVSKV